MIAARRCNLGEKVAVHALCVALSMAMYAVAAPAYAQSSTHEEAVRQYDIPAGPLPGALSAWGAQSGQQLVFPPELVQGKKSRAVSGRYTAGEALRRVLLDSGLEAEDAGGSIFTLRQASVPAKAPTSNRKSQSDAREEKDDHVVGMPAVMVKGARTLNMDIERTADDPQPYVVFSKAEIERSGSVNLEDFFRTRLPMNSAVASSAQNSMYSGNVSSINLRGLGNGQTLILVDGRRVGGTANSTTLGQPDINGIPIEAIERIEVLPTTASAIYGGSATGGVINIIMRRDYIGNSISLSYDNSFDTDSAIKRIDLSSGFSLLGGRTSVLLNASYVEGNDLLVRDRDFMRRHYENLQSRDPALYARTLPLGAGANIRSADGSNLVTKGGIDLGSSFTSAPDGYGGISTDGVAVLIANAGKYNLEPSNSTWPGEGGASELVTASPHVKYISGSIQHEFNENLRGFLDASRSENTARRASYRAANFAAITVPAASDINPFNQSIVVRTAASGLNGYAEHESVYNRLSSGFVFQLPYQWMGSADYTLTKSVTSLTEESPFIVKNSLLTSSVASGTLDILSDLDGVDWTSYMPVPYFKVSPTEVLSKNPSFRFSGPVGNIGGGKIQASILVEQQDSRFKESGQLYAMTEAVALAQGRQPGDYAAYLYPSRSRKINSAYLELRVPLVSKINEMPWVKELELQVSGRWDKYSTRSANSLTYYPPNLPGEVAYVRNELEEFSPLAAISFRPAESLMIRASYSKGFLPPDLSQLGAPSVGMFSRTFVDPLRGNAVETRVVNAILGTALSLDPEYTTTYSAGIVYTPDWLQGLRLSLDYTHLKKANGIASLGVQNILDNEQYLQGRVTRGPNLPTDPEGWAGPVTGIDSTYINLSSAVLEAYDLRADYTVRTGKLGTINLFALATFQTRYDTKVTSYGDTVDSLGWISGNVAPLDLKGNLGLEWELDEWTFGWGANYTSSYYVANPDLASSAVALNVQGNGGRVPSQTYHDVFAKYDFPSGSNGRGIFDNTEVRVGVRNIFNKTPPYSYTYAQYAAYFSNFGDPRLATYYITLRKGF